ncbi:MAG TPA: alpha/beta hydrolase, partial [Geomonas sp.]|nr:alpha/beta hydrolase [Geomonas sp.]
MKYMKLLFAATLILLPTLASAAEPSYGYPIEGPYAATILQTPAAFKPQLPEKVPMKELVLEVIPDLERPELFFYDKGLR